MDELNIVFETLLETREEYNKKVEKHDKKRADLVAELETF